MGIVSSSMLALCLAFAPQADLTAVRAALSSSDYPLAWELAQGQADALQRSRATSEVLYRAGDPSGALEQARQGLVEHPGDLQLLFRAAGASIWLKEAGSANHYSERLSHALEAARAQLGPEDASAWTEITRDFVAQGRSLARNEEARLRAVARSRALSLSAFAVVLAAISWAAWKGYGRSSRPVS